jgi:hypothetical protein
MQVSKRLFKVDFSDIHKEATNIDTLISIA